MFSFEWVKTRDAIESALSHAWRTLLNLFHPLIDQVAKDLGEALPAVIEAAAAAALDAAPEGKEAAYRAAKGAALDKATELGKQHAPDILLSIRTIAINETVKATA